MAGPRSRALFEPNLAAFREREPALFARLQGFEPEASLATTETGGLDLVVGGRSLFGGRHDEGIEELLAAYWESPSRLALTPPNPEQGDDVAGPFVADVLQRSGDAAIALDDRLTPGPGYFLIVFGIGLGAHIDPLVEKTGCRAVLFVEPAIEFLHHSLHTYDWRALFKSFDDSGRTVRFCCPRDAAQGCMEIKWALRESNACALDGAYYFKLGETPITEAILARWGLELIGVTEGLGCYADELVMVRNAHRNLGLGESRIYAMPSGEPLEVPVFLAGSGPSLEDAIGTIKENQDRAVVVSVGTALQPLLNNGISPDFHVESENYYPNMDEILAYLDGRPETKDIHLIGAVTCPEEMVRSYGGATLYFRAGQTPSHIYRPPDGATLIGGAPTVGNAGLSFVQWAGFRTFYLFGMDLGAHSAGRHHAEGSLGIVVQDFDIERPGNFGGTVLTTTVFFNTLIAVQEAVMAFSEGRRYFNCSDGCAIHGTEPLRPAELKLDPAPGGKAAVVRRLIEGARDYDPAAAGARLAESDVAAQVAALTEVVEGIVVDAPSIADNGHLSAAFELLAREDDSNATVAKMLVRGSIFNMLIAARYFSNRLRDRGQETLYRDAVRAAFGDALAGLNRRCAEDFRALAGDGGS